MQTTPGADQKSSLKIRTDERPQALLSISQLQVLSSCIIFLPMQQWIRWPAQIGRTGSHWKKASYHQKLNYELWRESRCLLSPLEEDLEPNKEQQQPKQTLWQRPYSLPPPSLTLSRVSFYQFLSWDAAFSKSTDCQAD